MDDAIAPERWLPVVGYEDLYEVSSSGRLRSKAKTLPGRAGSLRHTKPRMKHVKPGYGGYVTVGLWRNNKGRTARVHTLVLEAFVGPAPVGMECRHLDGNPSNNRMENLTWGTSTENKYDLVRHGTHHMVKRGECPRNHPLAGPNLRPKAKHRACFACAKACWKVRYERSQGREADLGALADAYYAEIMSAA